MVYSFGPHSLLCLPFIIQLRKFDSLLIDLLKNDNQWNLDADYFSYSNILLSMDLHLFLMILVTEKVSI